MSTEKPKRLPLTLQVVRNLYALSGNRCAAEGCQQPLVKADGTLVGEIAHSRAAMPDGPRFEASMTNEARRDQSNLMIICRNHHKIVDSRESEWTVEALTQLKDKHERIYSSALDHLRSQVSDITEGQTYTLPTNLGRLGEGWVRSRRSRSTPRAPSPRPQVPARGDGERRRPAGMRTGPCRSSDPRGRAGEHREPAARTEGQLHHP